MNVADLSMAERRALAADPATSPELLADLARDALLVSTIANNPATPAAVRDKIYWDFPSLNPHAGRAGAPAARQQGPAGTPDDALHSLQRRMAADQRYYATTASPRVTYTEVVDVSGNVVRVAVGQPATAATNTLAIVSLVTALAGLPLLAVVFGHVANAQIRQTGERGGGMASAGLTLGYLALVATVGFLLLTRT